MMFRHALIPAYLLLCLLMGGASLGGFAANLLLQLMAVPIIAYAFVTVRRTPMSASARQLLILTGLVVLLEALQLVPLPPSIWAELPGRAGVAAGYQALGEPLPWLPLTLDPVEALPSFLWLLPALAVLLGIVRLGWFRSTWIAYAVIAAGLIGLVVGTVQVASGALYFYRVTNLGVAVGFFANANHMATLLVCCIPFGAALLAGGGRRHRHSLQRRSARYVVGAAMGLLLVVGLALNGSIAGLGLGVPALGLSILMLLPPGGRWRKMAAGGALVAGIAAALILFFAPVGNMLAGEASISAEARRDAFNVTARAAADYMPLGSGSATFPEIYRSYEDPDAVDRFWWNHAHSDLLEIALEFGLPGLLLIAALLAWWIARIVAIWRPSEQPDRIARAATIASGAILLHSLVDYPLRTAGISALFAACLALMAQPTERQRSARSRSSAPAARHLSAD